MLKKSTTKDALVVSRLVVSPILHGKRTVVVAELAALRWIRAGCFALDKPSNCPLVSTMKYNSYLMRR